MGSRTSRKTAQEARWPSSPASSATSVTPMATPRNRATTAPLHSGEGRVKGHNPNESRWWTSRRGPHRWSVSRSLGLQGQQMLLPVSLAPPFLEPILRTKKSATGEIEAQAGRSTSRRVALVGMTDSATCLLLTSSRTHSRMGRSIQMTEPRNPHAFLRQRLSPHSTSTSRKRSMGSGCHM